jgi:hypothetical protein
VRAAAYVNNAGVATDAPPASNARNAKNAWNAANAVIAKIAGDLQTYAITKITSR